jgi:hypothetical protein
MVSGQLFEVEKSYPIDFANHSVPEGDDVSFIHRRILFVEKRPAM